MVASTGCTRGSTSSPTNAWQSVSPASSPLHPAGHSRSHPVRQRTGVRRQGGAGLDHGCRCQDRLNRAGQPPWENGYIKNFNARLRDELLNGEIFYTLREAQIVIES